MPVSLTIYPLSEPEYNGGRPATDHALFFLGDCPKSLHDEVLALGGRPIEQLELNFTHDGTCLYRLRAVPVASLAKLLPSYTTADRLGRSRAVVAFLGALPPESEAVPHFGY